MRTAVAGVIDAGYYRGHAATEARSRMNVTFRLPDEAAEERTVETERMFLRVLEEAGVEVTHEEHATLTIPPGDYEVKRQREYTPEEIRRVAD